MLGSMNLTFIAPSMGGTYPESQIKAGAAPTSWQQPLWLIKCLGLAKMRFLINVFSSCHNAKSKPAEDAFFCLVLFRFGAEGCEHVNKNLGEGAF